MKKSIKLILRKLLNETEFNYHKGDIENVENIRPYAVSYTHLTLPTTSRV